MEVRDIVTTIVHNHMTTPTPMNVDTKHVISLEKEEAGQRVLKAAWPDVQILPDITEITQKDTDAVVMRSPIVSLGSARGTAPS